MKINYVLNGYEKYVIGTLVSEDENFFTIKARDGKIFKIGKNTVSEVIANDGEFKEDDKDGNNI